MATEDFKPELTVVLSVDVVGYCRLMVEDESATEKTLETYKWIRGSRIILPAGSPKNFKRCRKSGGANRYAFPNQCSGMLRSGKPLCPDSLLCHRAEFWENFTPA